MTANGKARFGNDFPNDCIEIDGVVYLDSYEETNVTTLLEPPETTPPDASELSYRGRFMAGWEKEYAATESAYKFIYGSPSNSHLSGIRECRKFATFAREKITGEIKVFASSCRDRWCPMCAAQKAAYAKDQTELYTRSLKVPRFLTLTLRNDVQSLESQIDFLQDCFRRLRCRKFWRDNVTGGIWFLQVKRGKNSGCWHPHLHILLDGNYLEQGELSKLWELVTFGSVVLDIRKIHNVEAAAKYVARYSARPARLAEESMDDRIEIIKALQGKRLCGTFGTAKSVTLTPPKVTSQGEWQQVGYYDKVIKDAKKNKAAFAIVAAYHAERPISEELFQTYTGQPVYFVQDVVRTKKRDYQMLLDFYNTG